MSMTGSPSRRRKRSARLSHVSRATASTVAWAPETGDGDGTKYETVVNAIRGGIASGTLQHGQRLPPQRELAKHFDVTIATITKAIAEAVHRGLVVARPGSGTFVSAPAAPKAGPVPGGGPDPDPSPIDLSLNTPPVSVVADVLHQAMQGFIGTIRGEDLFGYEAIPGSARNRRAGAHWIAQRGVELSPDRVLLTEGAHEGLLVSLLAFTEPGDVVVCEALNYTGLRRIGQMLRLKLIGVGVDSEGLNVDELATVVRQHDVKAIVCTPATHNPTSAMLSGQRRTRLVAVARQAGIPIIEDDIYGALSNDMGPPLAALWSDGVILVSSLSKAVAPGLRTGYVVAPERWFARLRDTLFMLAWTGRSQQAAFATRLIETGAAGACVAAHIKEAGRRMAVARQALGSNLLTGELVSYHVWVDTGHLGPANVASELYQRGVLISPAQHFLIGQTTPPNAVRLSLGNVAERAMLMRSLGAVRAILDARRPVALGSIV